MIDSRYYTCGYCHKEYEPKRRRVQKYCSDTCRSKAYHTRTTITNNVTTTPQDVKAQIVNFKNKDKVEAMSVSGIGNATAGTLAADGIKALITHSDNKPATKGDLKNLVSEINGRFHLVKNIPPRIDGALPYFDFETNEIVFYFSSS